MLRFVVQHGHCSVHATGAVSAGLCVVKVKLTMRLAVGGSVLVFAHSIPRRSSPGSGGAVTQVASNSLVVARGGVGISPGGLAQEDQQQQREGFLRALPY
jgi:hypothetical protein